MINTISTGDAIETNATYQKIYKKRLQGNVVGITQDYTAMGGSSLVSVKVESPASYAGETLLLKLSHIKKKEGGIVHV